MLTEGKGNRLVVSSISQQGSDGLGSLAMGDKLITIATAAARVAVLLTIPSSDDPLVAGIRKGCISVSANLHARRIQIESNENSLA